MRKPNIVFILVDDLGWRDLGCYGSTFYETPCIDRLAEEGMRFTNAYAAAPVCSPTRASILTGKYPARIGITDWIDWFGSVHPARGRLVDAPYRKFLPVSEYALARALRDAGYATWHVGKWHLGGEGTLPEDHGFEVNIGGSHAGSPGRRGYFSPWTIPGLENADTPPGTYLTDYLTDRAINLIRQRGKRPFFLNLWHYAVHTPIQAAQPLIAKYEAKAKLLGLDKLQAFAEGEFFPCEHKKNHRIVRRLIQSDPAYAAMVENLDANVGRVLAAVQEAGEANNTIVVFTSDNGGLATSEGSPTCNAPLSEGKGWLYEGGNRVPLVVRWPEVVRAGMVSDTPVTSPDFYPTILEAVGLGSLPQQHCDGASFLAVLSGRTTGRSTPIFWHYPHYGNQGGTPGSAVRVEGWKLIEFLEDGHAELYDLENDPGEKLNLSAREPQRVRQMRDMLAAWRRELDVRFPATNPDWQHQQ